MSLRDDFAEGIAKAANERHGTGTEQPSPADLFASAFESFLATRPVTPSDERAQVDTSTASTDTADTPSTSAILDGLAAAIASQEPPA